MSSNGYIERVLIPARRAGLPTVVMLHEGLGSVSHWRDFPARLAERTGAAVLVYSRPGHGESDAPAAALRTPNYLHEEAWDVLPRVLAEAGISAPVVLFGHSDGASIALLYAGRFPQAVAGLIVEAPHVFVEDVTVAGVGQARDAYAANPGIALRLGRYHRDAGALFAAWSDIWLREEFRGWNIEEWLRPVRCPVLVIQGAVDEYATLAQVSAIEAAIPGTETMIVPDCRHSPHREFPEAVLDRAGEFFARRIV